MEQQERLQYVVRQLHQFITSHELSEIDALAGFVARHIARILPLLKNPAYRREDEWRLVMWDQEGAEPPQFDTTRGVLRPFLTLSLPTPVPLRKVYVMAPSRRAIAIKAATMLTRTYGLPDIEIVHSSIPFAE
jgi:hypothetical protein